jgi:O-antigen/teichoic acid export membrane protein
MNRIRRNIVANTLGRGWSTFLGVAVLPLYLRLLGAEAYGLVGLYTTIAVFCSLCDAGISASLGRELARANAEPDSGKYIADVVRTAEVLYLAIGLALGALISLGAPLIVTHWLNLRELKPAVAIRAVELMGVFFVFQWPTGLYLGGLAGLQKQVEGNVVSSIAASVRTIGTVVVLWWTSATITTFYVWQVIAAVGYFFAAREALLRAPELKRSEGAFRWSIVHKVRAFAGGLTLLSFLAVLVSQLDKIVLMRLVSLQAFGYYTFATSIAAATTFFSQPVLAATYPAMIAAHAGGDDRRLADLFHRGAQLVSVAIFAPAAVMFAFAPVVLRLWARDPATAANASVLISACLVGASLNSTAVMPYNLTLAAGRVGPTLVAGCAGLIVYAATLALFAPTLGVIAGAIGGALVNAIGLVIYAELAVNPLLPGHGWRWMRDDILVPLLAAAFIAVAVRCAASSRTSLAVQAAGLLLASGCTLAGAALATRTCRVEIAHRLRARRAKGAF